MRLPGAVLWLASGLALSWTGLAGAETCEDMYNCNFFVEQDQTLYKFDLSPLCSEQGYAFKDTINTVLNDTYNFNICGDSPKYCLPQGSSTYLTGGVAVQSWGKAPDCTRVQCKIPGTAATRCCTEECEVLGLDAPQFSLQEPQNAKTGGLIIKHQSAPNVLGSRNPCPVDRETGVQLARSVTFHIACNPKETLKWIDGDESPVCAYQMIMESKYACGKVWDGPGSAKSRDGLIAGMFFLGLFLGMVAIALYLVYKRGWFDGYLKFGGAGAGAAPKPSGTTKPGAGSASYTTVGGP